MSSGPASPKLSSTKPMGASSVDGSQQSKGLGDDSQRPDQFDGGKDFGDDVKSAGKDAVSGLGSAGSAAGDKLAGLAKDDKAQKTNP